MKVIQKNETAYQPLSYDQAKSHIEKIYENHEMLLGDIDSMRFDISQRKCFVFYNSLIIKSSGQTTKWPIQPYMTEVDFVSGIEILKRKI